MIEVFFKVPDILISLLPDIFCHQVFWKDYMKAYEEMIRETSTKESPWYVVPADNKSFARIVIASAIIDAMVGMKLSYPEVSAEKIAELQEIKKALLSEKH